MTNPLPAGVEVIEDTAAPPGKAVLIAPKGTSPEDFPDGWEEAGYVTVDGLTVDYPDTPPARGTRLDASHTATLTVPALPDFIDLDHLTFLADKTALDTPEEDPIVYPPWVDGQSQTLLLLAWMGRVAIYTPSRSRRITPYGAWFVVNGRLLASGPTVDRLRTLVATGLLTPAAPDGEAASVASMAARAVENGGRS